MNEVLEYLDSGATAATAGCSFMKGASNIYTSSQGTFAANTWIQIDHEILWIDAWNNSTGELTVARR